MSTLTDVEAAASKLSADDLAELERFVRKMRLAKNRPTGPSVFDLPPLNLGDVRSPLGSRDEWYDEMLEGRV